MRYNIVVATHHKTGTVWMETVFRSIAADLGVTYIDFRQQPERFASLGDGPFVLFNHDSDFGDRGDVLLRDDVRVLHLIRDPRDVVISAMHYHKVAGEDWLHRPMLRFGNLTYQQALRSLPSKLAQYTFEMDNSTASTLRDVMGWSYGQANCCEARYEELREDTNLRRWRHIMSFLGFDEKDREVGAREFWRHSLFGGMSRFGNKHVRSGEVAQWKREFTPDLANSFLRRFPGVLQTLGYEASDDWTLDLQPEGVTGVLAELRQFLAQRGTMLAGAARNPSKS